MLLDSNIIRTNQNSFEILKQKILKKLFKKRREEKNKSMQNQLKANDFTIIASFCGGGTIYHDLNMQFKSPTINLAFDGSDFCDFCANLEYNLEQEIKEYKTDMVSYPVGKIGDNIEIRFVHYSSFEEAKLKWQERTSRINYDKILLLSTDRDGMNLPENMEKFNLLPYKKIMFTARKYPYDWAIYCPYFKRSPSVGVMTGIADIHGNRFYEKNVDIINLLNSL